VAGFVALVSDLRPLNGPLDLCRTPYVAPRRCNAFCGKAQQSALAVLTFRSSHVRLTQERHAHAGRQSSGGRWRSPPPPSMAVGDFVGAPPDERPHYRLALSFTWGQFRPIKNDDGKCRDHSRWYYRLPIVLFVVNQTCCASPGMKMAGWDCVTSSLSRSFLSEDVAVAVHIFRMPHASRWTLKVSGLKGMDDVIATGFISEHAACAAFIALMADDDRLNVLNAAMIVPFDAVKLDS